MSRFAGKLKEYPSFSVDCFDEHNLDSVVYFLSHCHQDHMSGLDSTAFLNRLKTSQDILVYCSETTRNILLCDSKYKHLKPYLVGLPIEHPTIISINNRLTGECETLCVTLLPAGHCIGSVMFLWEGGSGSVLYTGDSVKEITSIYVDTTFCLPQMNHIPSREATKNAVVKLIKWWLRHGPSYYVSLLCKGMYGYEYLLKQIAIELKTKIHVSAERLALYGNLPDMTEHFSTKANMTKIHSCNWERDRHSSSKLPCGFSLPAPQQVKVMKIKPSSMWFARRKDPIPTDCVVKASENFYRVVHSMHASMEEIIDLVEYLRPRHVYATVEPAGLRTIEDAQKCLQPFTRSSGCNTLNSAREAIRLENSAELESKSMAEELPRLPEKRKSSNYSSVSRSASVPSDEVLAQCKQLGLMEETLAEIPRRRRRRNQSSRGDDQSQWDIFQEKEAACESNPHKREASQGFEAEKTTRSEIFSAGDKEVSNREIIKRASFEDSSKRFPEKHQRHISPERTVVDKNDEISDKIQEVEELSLGDGEVHLGVVRDHSCALDGLLNSSDYCIPASPGTEQPSQEMLASMHRNLAKRELSCARGLLEH